MTDVRVGVIGAGAIGGTIAALLDRGGHDVTVVARGANLSAIRERGIRLGGAEPPAGWGEHTAMVTAVERLDSPADLLVIATKAQDAAAALAQNERAAASALVLVVQNGLGGTATVASALGRDDIVGGLALYAASHLEPGAVTITAPGVTVLGGAGAGSVTATRAVADVLGTAMPVEVVADFAGAQWSKLLVNQVNALPAITGLSVQQVVADPRLRTVLVASMQELVRVARAGGVRFAPVQGLNDPLARLFGALPRRVAAFLPRLMARRMGDVPNPGSTLQSIRRGQRTEVDFLNGPVVEHGIRLGVPTPVNATLVAMVHEVEAGGFLPVEEVVRRVIGAVD
ncbi:2-dehydropantoate 2-reductase [Galbitalea sp. SE-J8]|uniref:ketopantoate reductase family protein n=1 Tax=Galbitalea sp. SE-J8 TaxID=3054952 RepID=UPI00259CE6D9|nr:2-dehydropantoate 2-reductase [Galbitalea sp. SE-J8]MDM4762634.1 2-dehydropantoate 2-reductase [Galbitalea sp. SE-J8]